MVRPPRSHTKPLRRIRSSGRKSLWRRLLPWVTMALVVAAAAIIMRLPDGASEWGSGWASGWASEWQRIDTRFSLCATRDSFGCVIDGDTILLGNGKAARKIRLSGFNAPEMKGECPAESALAVQSRDALRDWLNQGPFTMDGGKDPPRDQYGRELRVLKRGDEWLAETMIARKLAQESGWGFARGGWCD